MNHWTPAQAYLTTLSLTTCAVVLIGTGCAQSRLRVTEPHPERTIPTSSDIHAPVKAGASSMPLVPRREIPESAPGKVRFESDGGATYEVTAYSHGCIMPRNGKEGPPRRAANGRWPIADVTVAADTSVHPFGTEVIVEGIGFRTVGDRGHAIKGRKLDLFVDTCREARRFGRQWLRVHAVPVETTLEAQ